MRPCCCSCFCSSRVETFFVGILEVTASVIVSVTYAYYLFIYLVNLLVQGGKNTEYYVSMLMLFCGHILGMTRLVFGVFLLFAIHQGSVALLVRWIKAKIFLLFFSVSVQVILFGTFGQFSPVYWYWAAGSFLFSVYLLLIVYNYFVEVAGTSWLPKSPIGSPTISPSVSNV